MKQKAKIYKGKRIVIGDKNLVTKNEIHVNDIPKEGGESGGGDTPSTPSPSKRTGHADAEGLRAIGWTDEDIAYYQENGVNWNEEDDEYHKVTDDNKALYGVLTADNISTYRDRIVYLPKIDTSGKTSMLSMFYECYSLVAIPQLDTQNVKTMRKMFFYCRSLTSIPLLDTANVENMSEMFNGCSSLVSIPQLDTQNVTNMGSMFNDCRSLTHANIKNAKLAYQLKYSALLSKESLLYLINNEAAESAITIQLASYAYNKWSVDADVIAALEAHPNISISA